MNNIIMTFIYIYIYLNIYKIFKFFIQVGSVILFISQLFINMYIIININ